jgi:hypothetical protein
MQQEISSPILEVLYQKSFGKEYFWPENQIAKTICEMMHKKTFSRKHLELAKNRGWTVLIKTVEVNI